MKARIRTCFPDLFFLFIRCRIVGHVCWQALKSRSSGFRGLALILRGAALLACEACWYMQESWLKRHRVECNLCGWTGYSFRPVFSVPRFGDTTYRARAVCPSCHSRERHRLSFAFLQANLLRTQGRRPITRVLHVAPEAPLCGFFRQLEGVQYSSVDLRSELAQVHMDVCALGFDSGTFDFLYCSHVLPFIEVKHGDVLALREFHRVLRPGGWGMLLIPEDETLERSIEYEGPHPEESFAVRRYGQDFHQRLRKVGFIVEVVPFVESLDRQERARLGLRNEKIYVISR